MTCVSSWRISAPHPARWCVLNRFITGIPLATLSPNLELSTNAGMGGEREERLASSGGIRTGRLSSVRYFSDSELSQIWGPLLKGALRCVCSGSFSLLPLP